MMVQKALTIAGSDSGGGAGIQADLKTFQELGVYGMSAITAVTAQNTLGVHGVYPIEAEGVYAQLKALAEDLAPDAVKTGMLFSTDIIEAVAGAIEQFGWQHTVVDPVMIAKGGTSLLQSEAITAVKTRLLPLAEMVTPNIPEAAALTGRTISCMEDRREAARQLAGTGVSYVLIKGGHAEEEEEAIDLLFDGRHFFEYRSPRIKTKNTHGTGCTFSAAIAAGFAEGYTAEKAVQRAKAFIQAAIGHDLGLGSGHGPTNHWAYRKEQAE